RPTTTHSLHDALPIFPPAILRREERGDEDLVDGRPELHVRVSRGKRARVLGEVLGKVAVLEIADPVGHAEVTKIQDGLDVERARSEEHTSELQSRENI